MAYDYELLKVETEGRLAWVTVSNPPINLITLPLYAELVALSQELAADKDLTVVVMKSADPDFFLAHFDVSAILQFPIDEPATRETQLNDYHLMCERFRTMDKVTIAQIEGRVGGGGSELAASFDMRFGVAGKTRINQMEVPLGILPGGTGTQRLPRLVGRGRALEIVLGGDDLDAETAERWGYLNRVYAEDAIAPAVRHWPDASRPSRLMQFAWRRSRSRPQKNRCPKVCLMRPGCSSACCARMARRKTCAGFSKSADRRATVSFGSMSCPPSLASTEDY